MGKSASLGACFPRRPVTAFDKPHLPLHGHIFPFHGHIFPFMGIFSLSWAHLPFNGDTSLSWANLPLHGHICSLICSHHSSPANLGMHQRTESEAKAKAKAKPNMMIICSCKPCRPEDFQIIFCVFQVHSS